MSNKELEEINRAIAEISEKIDILSKKQNTQYTDVMLSLKKIENSLEELTKEPEEKTDDQLYKEAKELVIESRKASASFLQRRLKIGYARAVHILDLLEVDEIIGPSNEVGQRKILVEE